MDFITLDNDDDSVSKIGLLCKSNELNCTINEDRYSFFCLDTPKNLPVYEYLNNLTKLGYSSNNITSKDELLTFLRLFNKNQYDKINKDYKYDGEFQFDYKYSILTNFKTMTSEGKTYSLKLINDIVNMKHSEFDEYIKFLHKTFPFFDDILDEIYKLSKKQLIILIKEKGNTYKIISRVSTLQFTASNFILKLKLVLDLGL